jgi:RimJ/RimL family protein N-acetyltransferase
VLPQAVIITATTEATTSRLARRGEVLCGAIISRCNAAACRIDTNVFGMRVPSKLHTPRLVLRRWRAGDRHPFAQLNSDPIVVEHLAGALNREESDAFADRLDAGFDQHGYGIWAVELLGEARFIGYTGLSLPSFEAPFMPAVEVGWRLAHDYWGRGYATEAARAAVADGFSRAGLSEIVSFTVPANVRSTRVMERIGMTHDPADDFDHPRFPVGHRLSRHVLYRLKREAWRATNGAAEVGAGRWRS